MIQPVLGIDIAKETFDVALIVEGKIQHEHLDNNAKGFKRLCQWAERYTHESIHACLEGQRGQPRTHQVLCRE
jgi:transposase